MVERRDRINPPETNYLPELRPDLGEEEFASSNSLPRNLWSHHPVTRSAATCYSSFLLPLHTHSLCVPAGQEFSQFWHIYTYICRSDFCAAEMLERIIWKDTNGFYEAISVIEIRKMCKYIYIHSIFLGNVNLAFVNNVPEASEIYIIIFS